MTMARVMLKNTTRRTMRMEMSMLETECKRNTKRVTRTKERIVDLGMMCTTLHGAQGMTKTPINANTRRTGGIVIWIETKVHRYAENN